MIKTFACEATIPKSGLKSMSDGGWRVSVDTQELSPEKSAELMQFKGMFGKFVFASKEGEIKAEDIDVPDVTPEFKGEKSPSQRLRAVIYILWQQNGEKGEFETYYRGKMDTLINLLKEKLN
jgi:hypothetical protein